MAARGGSRIHHTGGGGGDEQGLGALMVQSRMQDLVYNIEESTLKDLGYRISCRIQD